MRLLFIGGTQFVGRHIVQAALARGHEVVLFHRGETNPGLFPSATEIHGDRDGELERLGSGSWDAVVDTCGYVPSVVESSARYLRGKVGRYVFISSVSAYADLSQPGVDENAPLGTLNDPSIEEVDDTTYGPLKALCEGVVRDAYAEASTVVRPGLVVGPHDPTDRFTYWPARVARGGQVLAPAPPDRPVQFIDARDLGAFVVNAIERDLEGTFNVVTEPGSTTMGALLATCREVAHADAEFVWADDGFLLDAGVEPWVGLPLWIPATDEDSANMLTVSPARAFSVGLRCRPVADTVRGTLDWHRAREPAELRAGLGAAEEARLISAAHGRA